MSLRAARTVKLRNGSRAELFCSGCPVETAAGQKLCWFLENAHPGMEKPDIFIARAALGHYEKSARNYFFWAEVEGEIASTAWYTIPADDRRIGTFGEVFTAEELRGLGLATEVSRLALEHFQQRGGRCLFLATSNPIAERLYQRLGFEGYPEGLMRFLSSGCERFEDEWFAPKSKVGFRSMRWGDLPRVVALYGAGNPWVSVSFTDGLFSRDHVLHRRCNSLFKNTFQRTLRGLWTGAFTENGALVGSCPASPFGNEKEVVEGVVDLFCHPNYRGSAYGLLMQTSEAARNKGWRWLSAWVPAADDEKRQLLQGAGFEKVTTFPDAFRLGGELQGVNLLRRALSA